LLLWKGVLGLSQVGGVKIWLMGELDYYALVLSSTRMLYITNANEATIVAIEAISIIPNIFSPFLFILS
jgi:hypothetical protein